MSSSSSNWDPSFNLYVLTSCNYFYLRCSSKIYSSMKVRASIDPFLIFSEALAW